MWRWRPRCSRAKVQSSARGGEKSGADWKPALSEYERIAVAPPVLEAWLSVLDHETNWRAALDDLVQALEPSGHALPASAKGALSAARALLGW